MGDILPMYPDRDAAERGFDGSLPPHVRAAIESAEAQYRDLPRANQLAILIVKQSERIAIERSCFHASMAERREARDELGLAREFSTGIDFAEMRQRMTDERARRDLSGYRGACELLRRFEAEAAECVAGFLAKQAAE